jgi:hypothetical protein
MVSKELKRSGVVMFAARPLKVSLTILERVLLEELDTILDGMLSRKSPHGGAVMFASRPQNWIYFLDLLLIPV